MKSFCVFALALLSTSAFASPSRFNIESLECSLSNAAGRAEISIHGDTGSINTAFGDVPVMRSSGASYGGLVNVNITYRSRMMMGQSVDVIAVLYAPNFESDKEGTAYRGVLYGTMRATFLMPAAPLGYGAGGGYGIGGALGGLSARDLPVGAFPVGLLRCELTPEMR